MKGKGKGITPAHPEVVEVEVALVCIEGRNSEAKVGAITVIFFGRGIRIPVTPSP